METAVQPMIFSALTVSQKLNATGMRFRGTSIGGSILAVHPYTSLSIDRPTYLAVYPILSYRIELNQIESNTILSHPSIHPSILSNLSNLFNLSNLICRSIYLPLSLSIVLCIYLSIYLSIDVSLYPAIRASMYHVSIMCIHSHISIQDYICVYVGNI